ncbi:MAG TPA: helix-turn-helix domain-containing protein [Dyella sp.]|uniref:helix-turn-helix domain-containing protein n=1 Tax=Dyella sp. TaxID=1869338 RepID=UPI002D78CC3E|nr:helix-turn-helix domain-containing protein [Dyella sp.]HET6554031.1 helix-turn-helix domain-containing protein [Dyella sp.]
MLQTHRHKDDAHRMTPSPSCAGCGYASVCQASGYDRAELSGLRHIAERIGPLRTGEYLYRPLSPFRALYAVQSGMAKTVAVDVAGREQVLAFHLPGEMIGLDAVDREFHDNAVVALGKTQFCRLPFSAVRQVSAEQPDVPWHLMTAASQRISRLQLSGGNYLAEERFAAFLVDMRDRRAVLGLSADYLPLPMSRADIGNHLRLTTETVSRLLGRFRQRELVKLDRQGLHLVDLPGLRELGQSLLMH